MLKIEDQSPLLFRYTCKMCDFGHDRSQSVQTHGKREHGREDIVEDRIDVSGLR